MCDAPQPHLATDPDVGLLRRLRAYHERARQRRHVLARSRDGDDVATVRNNIARSIAWRRQFVHGHDRALRKVSGVIDEHLSSCANSERGAIDSKATCLVRRGGSFRDALAGAEPCGVPHLHCPVAPEGQHGRGGGVHRPGDGSASSEGICDAVFDYKLLFQHIIGRVENTGAAVLRRRHEARLVRRVPSDAGDGPDVPGVAVEVSHRWVAEARLAHKLPLKVKHARGDASGSHEQTVARSVPHNVGDSDVRAVLGDTHRGDVGDGLRASGQARCVVRVDMASGAPRREELAVRRERRCEAR
eukprot:PhM_4_TR15148/c1_g1_i1/m.18868